MKHCDHCGAENANTYSMDVKTSEGHYCSTSAGGDLCDSCLREFGHLIKEFFARSKKIDRKPEWIPASSVGGE